MIIILYTVLLVILYTVYCVILYTVLYCILCYWLNIRLLMNMRKEKKTLRNYKNRLLVAMGYCVTNGCITLINGCGYITDY